MGVPVVNGRYVLVNGLRSGDIQHFTDFQTYLIDRSEPRITLIRAPSGRSFAEPVHGVSISADGGYVTFQTADPLLTGSFIRSTSAPTIDSVVTGTHFVDGTAFAFGDGISVGSVTVTDEHHATVHVTAAPNAVSGPRAALAVAPGSGAGMGTGGLELFPGLLSVGT